MATNQVKMRRTRLNARHLDQHYSFAVFARHERSGERFGGDAVAIYGNTYCS